MISWNVGLVVIGETRINRKGAILQGFPRYAVVPPRRYFISPPCSPRTIVEATRALR
jgi:hypothetical protein